MRRRDGSDLKSNPLKRGPHMRRRDTPSWIEKTLAESPELRSLADHAQRLHDFTDAECRQALPVAVVAVAQAIDADRIRFETDEDLAMVRGLLVVATAVSLRHP